MSAVLKRSGVVAAVNECAARDKLLVDIAGYASRGEIGPASA